MKKYIIFDFDGVLADAKTEFLAALNYALEKLDKPIISIEEFDSHSKWGLLNKRAYSKLTLFFLVRHAKKYMKQNIKKVDYFNNVLEEIEKIEHDCIIVSSNSVANITKVLGDKTRFFKKIYGNQGIMGKVKTLKKLKSNSIYFTDEVRDIIQCQKVGMPVYAITWGFDPENELRKHNPNGIVSSPTEINKIVNSEN